MISILAPWKKSYDKPRRHIKKQRHFFTDKGLYSQALGFSSSHVWMWEDHKESRALNQRTDAFKLWCWRRLLRVPWTARRSNQFILKEINPEYSLEYSNRIYWNIPSEYSNWCWSWSSNSFDTWCKEPTHCKRPWCWERLKEKSGQQLVRLFDRITDSMNMNLSKLQEIEEVREA